MKQEFQDKFGVSYSNFVNLSVCITAFISVEEYDLFKHMLPSILNGEEKKLWKKGAFAYANINEVIINKIVILVKKIKKHF